jgi:hypothetical protein
VDDDTELTEEVGTFQPWRREGDFVVSALPLAGGAAPTEYRIRERHDVPRTHYAEDLHTARPRVDPPWARGRVLRFERDGSLRLHLDAARVPDDFHVPGIGQLEGDRPLSPDLPTVRVASVESTGDYWIKHGLVLRQPRPWAAPQRGCEFASQPLDGCGCNPCRARREDGRPQSSAPEPAPEPWPWVDVRKFDATVPLLPWDEDDDLTAEQAALVETLEEPPGGEWYGRKGTSHAQANRRNVEIGGVERGFLKSGGWTPALPGQTWEPVGRPRGQVPPPEELLEELDFDAETLRRFFRKGRRTPDQDRARAWVAIRVSLVVAKYRGRGINEALAKALECSVDTIETAAAEGRQAREELAG